LIKLCKKTNSKQIFYYLNKWADNQIKSKCFSEFNRTFGQWFNFQKKPEKYKEIFVDSCNILMSTLNVKHILLKNANKIYQFSSNYENIHEKKYNEEEKAFYSYVFYKNIRRKVE